VFDDVLKYLLIFAILRFTNVTFLKAFSDLEWVGGLMPPKFIRGTGKVSKRLDKFDIFLRKALYGFAALKITAKHKYYDKESLFMWEPPILCLYLH